jgi:Fe-S-cluster containining protein
MDQVTIAGKLVAAKALPLLEPERNALSQQLRHRDLDSASVALTDLYVRLERNTRDAIDRSGLVPACHRGCGWCCHGVKVNVSALEALVIANHLKLAEPQLQADVKAAAEHRRELTAEQLFVSGARCPFLSASHDCRIHAVRPIACRRHCCMDASECERAIENPKLKLVVSQHSAVLAVGTLAGLAVAAALQDARLDHREFELTSAVSVALEAGSMQRWIAGESVFDRAVRPADALDRAISEAEIGASRASANSPKASSWRSGSKKRRRAKVTTK